MRNEAILLSQLSSYSPGIIEKSLNTYEFGSRHSKASVSEKLIHQDHVKLECDHVLMN